ncbi:hypothetical protein [Thalassotalea sp. ND16A]|uniref:hypothetical protein n=1 Tax=Thalassotalea sp. ND16A TaxID=1535422 RepID=UPI000519EF7A|nr:hypothetical protein [Thalassotalea sp. ND16A]KGJ92211.1 hypothetical protein ND16A_1730 [Thalassotalea sp. ND16A]
MTALFNKLNLKQQQQIVVLNAPLSFSDELKQLTGIDVLQDVQKVDAIEFCLCFAEQQQQLHPFIEAIVGKLDGDAVLWFAYPKKSSQNYQSDISRDQGWQPLGQAGFEGVRQVAIDEDWSALRFRKAEYIQSLKRNPKWIMSAEGKTRAKK